MIIQDLTIDQASDITVDLLLETTSLAKRSGIKAVAIIEKDSPIVISELRYDGFVIQFCIVPETLRREWNPNKDYDKNYFCTYFYYGTSTEYFLDGTMNKIFNEDGGVGFLNDCLVQTEPTYEMFGKTAWLCFSSWKPYTGTFLQIRDTGIIPAGAAAVVTLGSLTSNKMFEYIAPQKTDTVVHGNADVVLIKHGEFVNVPP